MVIPPVVVDFDALTVKDYWTPLAPDLGVFVSHKHGFEVSGGSFYWNEFPPFDAAGFIPHQVYVRLLGGEALFAQRVHCWLTDSGDPPPFLTGQPPTFLLGGGPAAPTDWVQFPVQQSNPSYWFVGEHRRPGQTQWERNKKVGHSFDLYKNGTLSTVGWEDATDGDFNDLIMEVAVVFRRNYFFGALPLKLSAVELKAAKRAIAADPRLSAGKAPPKLGKAETGKG